MTVEEMYENQRYKATIAENAFELFQMIENGMIPNYVSLLYSTILARAPVRTGKLKSSIELKYYGEGVRQDGIVAEVIIAPNVPYARATNDRSEGPKQQYNFQWIDKAIEQVDLVMTEMYGGAIDYDKF